MLSQCIIFIGIFQQHSHVHNHAATALTQHEAVLYVPCSICMVTCFVHMPSIWDNLNGYRASHDTKCQGSPFVSMSIYAVKPPLSKVDFIKTPPIVSFIVEREIFRKRNIDDNIQHTIAQCQLISIKSMVWYHEMLIFRLQSNQAERNLILISCDKPYYYTKTG